MNRSFKFGDGFFETIRVEKGQPTLWPFHADRILLSCDVMGITVPDAEKLNTILKDLIGACADINLARARLTFFRSGNGAYLPQSNDLAYEIEIMPAEYADGAIFPTHSGNYDDLLRDVAALPAQGIGLYPDAAKVFSPFSFLKSTSAILYVHGAMYASQMGWDDAFILNETGHIIETTNSNIFAVFNDQIYTPGLNSGCVAGVCRAYLMDRYEIREASFSQEDLRSADMIFRSNAVHGVRRISFP